MFYEVSTNIFDVKVDGQPYVLLPYLAPNHNYGDAEDSVFTAMIMVNDDVVFDETIHWNFLSISEKIEVQLGAENMKKF